MRLLDRAANGSGGAVAAAASVLLGSACCVGPLALGLSYVGLSASTLLTVENVIGPYRPVLLSATVSLLGFAFYGVYRPREDCGPEEACARTGSRRFQRLAAWAAAGLFAVLLYFTYIHPNLDVWFGIYL